MRNRLQIQLILLAGLLQIVLTSPSLAQSTSETAKEKEQAAQEAAKIKAAEEKARIRAEIAAEKAKIARERALAIWRAHHPTPPAPKSPSPTPPSPGTVSIPDYCTSPKILLPSTYNTKRNAYKSPNWYLCPKHGHGTGTLNNPWCLDDLVVGNYNANVGNSAVMSTMQPGQVLALLPGNYNMNVGTADSAGRPLNYLLMVPAGTASSYSVVTAADPSNPPVLTGASGLNYLVGSINDIYCSYSIYENLVVNINEGGTGIWFMNAVHPVVRNCNVQGSHITPFDDNRDCVRLDGCQHGQVYDNYIWGNNAPGTNGSPAENTTGVKLYSDTYTDIFHNCLYDNDVGTRNKASGGQLPAPYSDLSAYRANYYDDGLYLEYNGTNQGPADTCYVCDNVFAYVSSADALAVAPQQTASTVFFNNLSFMPNLFGCWDSLPVSYSNRVYNNIVWTSTTGLPMAYGDSIHTYSNAGLAFMDYNVYLGATGTSIFNVLYPFGEYTSSPVTYDMQQMRQNGHELHSSVYASPSQVFSDTSKYTLQPQFLKAASDGGAVGPRVPIDYISNPAWYGPNAPLNPYKLGISIAP